MRQTVNERQTAITLAAGALALAVALVGFRPKDGPPAPAGAHTSDAPQRLEGIWLWGLAALQSKPAAPATPATPAASASPRAAPARASTHPDEWSVQDGLLRPTSLLRERFDRMRKLRTLEDDRKLRAQVLREAQAAHGADLARQIVGLWDLYIGIEHHAWETRLDLQDRSTWQPAADERQTIQAQRLGYAWAQAFYGDENRFLQQLLDTTPESAAAVLAAERPALQASAGASAGATAGLGTLRQQRLQMLGPEVTAALERAAIERTQRELKLIAARDEWKRLKANPALSDERRDAAMRAWIGSNFRSEDRARVLIALGLP